MKDMNKYLNDIDKLSNIILSSRKLYFPIDMIVYIFCEKKDRIVKHEHIIGVMKAFGFIKFEGNNIALTERGEESGFFYLCIKTTIGILGEVTIETKLYLTAKGFAAFTLYFNSSDYLKNFPHNDPNKIKKQ